MTIPYDPHLYADLNHSDRVSGTDPSGGFKYDLDLSIPALTTAIHAGHTVRHELAALMTLSEIERQKEEDTATDRIIQSCPNRLWGLDSRAEYDLNRPPELALPLTPEMFWGTRVFGKQLPTDAMNQRSLDKYEALYRFVATVIKVLLDRFGNCVIYDIHSYNILRQIKKGHLAPPLFNLGTRAIDQARWDTLVVAWLEELKKINVPDSVTSVAENDVFGGRGEFCRRLTRWDPNILVLPTEISKIYMDERSGVVHDSKVHALRKGLAQAVTAHSREFQQAYAM